MGLDRPFPIGLQKDEKETLRNNLLHFMEQHPVAIDEKALLFKLHLRPIPVIMALLIAVSSGVGFAAENSYPGDFLYPYKIHVNENIRSLMALTPEAKGKLAINLAHERLSEAAMLAVKGELTVEVRNDLEKNFEKHITDSFQHLDELKSAKKFTHVSDLAIGIEADLVVHEEIFNELSEYVLVEKINPKIGIANQEKINANKKIKTSPNVKEVAQDKLIEAEDNLKSAVAIFDDEKDDIKKNTEANAEKKLEEASILITKGKSQIEDEKFGEAFATLQEGEQKILEAEGLIKCKTKFEHGEGEGLI